MKTEGALPLAPPLPGLFILILEFALSLPHAMVCVMRVLCVVHTHTRTHTGCLLFILQMLMAMHPFRIHFWS